MLYNSNRPSYGRIESGPPHAPNCSGIVRDKALRNYPETTLGDVKKLGILLLKTHCYGTPNRKPNSKKNPAKRVPSGIVCCIG